ncbi:MAG: hypothetical protein HYV39_01135 [Candidatus Levybacteria bacterium]|nr:hypothetical protein [Candidatus Levybacteria bacterium]
MYGKRPLWQWVLIYAVIGVIIYGGVYYFFLRPGSGYKLPYSPPTEQSFPFVGQEKEAALETAELLAVGEYKGSGSATRSFDGTTFTHKVSASLNDPPAGKFYEGWLVDKEPTLTFFSTGRLTKEGDMYVLTFTSSQNYPEYNTVVITEETESMGLDGKPEAHVLEGFF